MRFIRIEDTHINIDGIVSVDPIIKIKNHMFIPYVIIKYNNNKNIIRLKSSYNNRNEAEIYVNNTIDHIIKDIKDNNINDNVKRLGNFYINMAIMTAIEASSIKNDQDKYKSLIIVSLVNYNGFCIKIPGDNIYDICEDAKDEAHKIIENFLKNK